MIQGLLSAPMGAGARERIGRWVRAAALLLGIGLAAASHAAITCNTSNVNKTFSAGTFSVANVAIGATIKTLAADTFQLNCRFISASSPVDTSATLYSDFSTTAALVPGTTDVYQTGIVGLGVRYVFDSAACNAAGVALTNGSVRLNCPFSGPLDGAMMPANVTVTASLILTSAMPQSATTLTSMPKVSIGYAHSDQSVICPSGV